MFRVEAGCITTNASAPLIGGWTGVAPCPPAFQTGALLRELPSHEVVATTRLARASSWIQTRRFGCFTLVALVIGSSARNRPGTFRLSGGCSAIELRWSWLAHMDSNHECRINNPV